MKRLINLPDGPKERMTQILEILNSDEFIDANVEFVHTLSQLMSKSEARAVKHLMLRNTQFFMVSLKNVHVFRQYMTDEYADAALTSFRFIKPLTPLESHSLFITMVDSDGISNDWFVKNWENVSDFRPDPSVITQYHSKGLMLLACFRRFFESEKSLDLIIDKKVCLWLAESILYHYHPTTYFSEMRFTPAWLLFKKNLAHHGLKELAKYIDEKLDGKISNWQGSISRKAA